MSSSGSRHHLTRQEKRDKRLATLIAKSVAKAVSDAYENASKSSEESRTNAPKDASKTGFSFKQFKACGPKEFTGEDGLTAMFQWFDLVEVTLRQSGCPENLRTLNATGVFQSRALDWWTAERSKRGNDAAYELTWEELKEIMMDEFCPPHERQKLEDEFWNIKQKDGDNAALTARLKQLSIICPDQVKTPDMVIKKYIRALPDCVADFVHAAKTSSIEETYLLAAEINDKRVKSGFWDKPSKSLHQATATSTVDTTTAQPSKLSGLDPTCVAGPSIAENLVCFHVYSFSSFLFSSLVALSLKQAIRISKTTSCEPRRVLMFTFDMCHINKNVLRTGYLVSAVGSVCGCGFLMMALVNVAQIKLGVLGCESGSAHVYGAVVPLLTFVPLGLLTYVFFVLFAFTR
ncbi:putative retrotransposon gag domain-containing protein [Helianthus annuus]|nr:putative retrotransposon gag domain-containing protein [Helianthus annuus]